MFHDTIAANLRYAKPDASDEELVEAGGLYQELYATQYARSAWGV